MADKPAAFTLVFYYIPEDYDELAMPNAFAIPKQVNDITLQDIEQFFPLKQGGEQFYFRFKYKYNTSSVWLDLNNRKVGVPKHDGKIIMKVTRKEAKYVPTGDNSSAAASDSYQ